MAATKAELEGLQKLLTDAESSGTKAKGKEPKPRGRSTGPKPRGRSTEFSDTISLTDATKKSLTVRQDANLRRWIDRDMSKEFLEFRAGTDRAEEILDLFLFENPRYRSKLNKMLGFEIPASENLDTLLNSSDLVLVGESSQFLQTKVNELFLTGKIDREKFEELNAKLKTRSPFTTSGVQKVVKLQPRKLVKRIPASSNS